MRGFGLVSATGKEGEAVEDGVRSVCRSLSSFYLDEPETACQDIERIIGVPLLLYLQVKLNSLDYRAPKQTAAAAATTGIDKHLHPPFPCRESNGSSPTLRDPPVGTVGQRGHPCPCSLPSSPPFTLDSGFPRHPRVLRHPPPAVKARSGGDAESKDAGATKQTPPRLHEVSVGSAMNEQG